MPTAATRLSGSTSVPSTYGYETTPSRHVDVLLQNMTSKFTNPAALSGSHTAQKPYRGSIYMGNPLQLQSGLPLPRDAGLLPTTPRHPPEPQPHHPNRDTLNEKHIFEVTRATSPAVGRSRAATAMPYFCYNHFSNVRVHGKNNCILIHFQGSSDQHAKTNGGMCTSAAPQTLSAVGRGRAGDGPACPDGAGRGMSKIGVFEILNIGWICLR